MKLNSPNLYMAFKGFKTVYNEAFADAESFVDKIAMLVNSTTSEEEYGWLGQFPGLREWLGERVVKSLRGHGFTIRNKTWESTVVVSRSNIEDDQVGIYRPMFQEMGRVAKQHPDTLLFKLLQSGFTTPGFDGAPFFSDLHPRSGEKGDTTDLSSNYKFGPGAAPWFLLDLSRAIKPLIWQVRKNYEMESIEDPRSSSVFLKDEFLFGVRARGNVGLGLWQLAYGSKDELTLSSYLEARTAMASYTGDQGNILGIRPTHMVVPLGLEPAARAIIKADQIDGTTNVWKDTVELIVSPYLSM